MSACVALALVTTPLVHADEGFQLAFAEEFDGPQLNRAFWQTTIAFVGRQGGRYHNDSYLSYVTDEDVTLEGGTLRLRADRRPVTGDDPVGNFNYSQGLVSTHERFSFTYGYVEVRAKLPAGRGVWPTIWLMPVDLALWPPEFDIMEFYGGAETVRFGLASGNMIEPKWDDALHVDPKVQDDWHVFSLLWEPGRALWMMDGEVKLEVKGDRVPSHAMYLILNNGVSSRVGPSGEPDEKTVFPNYLEIDYVRIYQKAAKEFVSAEPVAASS